jgi:predicted lipoprotein
MKHPLRWAGVAAGAVFVALIPSSVTIVRGGELVEQQASEEFDPVTYVESIWESELVPTVEREAEDLPTILGAMEVNADGIGATDQLTEVAEAHGTITVGQAHVYLVSGTGTVTAVDGLGLATVQLDGYDGPIEVQLYMGTRIPSDDTSVRDAVGFIQFGDFREQTEYGKVGSEINKRIVREVIEPLGGDDLVGQRINFLGAMGIRTFNLVQIDLSSIRVVPVAIELED